MQEQTKVDPVNALIAFAEGREAANVLQIGSRQITLIEVFRYLPGHRLTALAKLNGLDVVIKCFFGSKAKASFEREVAGLKALEQAGVPTPSRHLELESDSDGLWLLALSYLDHCKTLRQMLDTSETPETAHLLETAVNLFAQLHQSGLTQPDPHLDNFLWYQQTLYMIDAGLIDPADSALKREKALDNLALFFAQLPPNLDPWVHSCLPHYLAAMGYPEDEFSADWDTRLLVQRRWREHRFIDKKVFRSCTAFEQQGSFKDFMVWDRALSDRSLLQEMHHPEALFEQGEPLVAGPDTSRVVQISDQTYRLDRFSGLGLGWSPAALAWRNAQRLLLLGIPVLQPVCFQESRLGPVRTRSFLLSQWSGASTLESVINNEVDVPKAYDWRPQLDGLLDGLKRCQLLHGRLTTQAIVVTEGHCVLTELEEMRHLDGAPSDQALLDREQATLLEATAKQQVSLN